MLTGAPIEEQDKINQNTKKQLNGFHQKSYADLEMECLSHMAANGIPFEGQLQTDGKIYRFSVDDKKNQKDEWYTALTGISQKGNHWLTCRYGSWSTGKSYIYDSWKENDAVLDAEELEYLRKCAEEAKKNTEKKIQEEHERAAQECHKIWECSTQNPTSDKHQAYFKLKQIKPHGIRYGKNQQKHECAIIPLHNNDGRIRSIQYISVGTDRTVYKSFHGGGEKKGNYFTFGTIQNGGKIGVCEGYATGASCFEATGMPVVVAFDSGSLSPVIENIRKKYPDNEIEIFADDDRQTDGNTGRTKAEEAAKKYRCRVALPVFPEGYRLPGGKHPTDFNDLHVNFGIEEVRRQITGSVISTSSVNEELKKLNYSLLEKEEPCASFSTKDLPKQLREYVDSICEMTDAHPIMITTSVISSLSGIIKKRLFLPKGEYFQTLYPNVWMLNLYKSGGFKSTAMENGSAIAREKSNESIREMRRIEDEIKRREKEKKELGSERHDASLKNVILPNKITGEALLEHLSEGHAGVILTGEFGAWLQNMDKSHNSDLKGIFTELYDVPPSYRYKTKTQGDHILEEPFFSIFGVSTLTWLKENLNPNDVSSGFFARFLLFKPPHKDCIPPALPRVKRPSNAEAEWMVKKTLENMDNEYRYALSPAAKLFFESAHNSLYAMTKAYSEKCQIILDPYLKRWSPYLLKLSMIMRLFEDPTSKEITDTALHSALSILLPAIRSTAGLFEGELGESDLQRKCRVVFDWICQRVEKSGKQVQWKEIITSRQLEGGSLEYEYVCKNLIESGKLISKEKTLRKDWLYVPNTQMVEKVEKS